MSKPRIFLFDIETMPNVADIWQLRTNYVPFKMIRENDRMAMWSGKYAGESGIITMNEHEHGQESMVKGLWHHMNYADTTVGHNGDKFDIKWANRTFLEQGLAPPAPTKSVDTLKVCKQNFRFPSYALNYICPKLGIGNKIKHTGHELWQGWEAKDPAAIKLMIKYCNQDVMLLQRLYYRIRPWIKSHAVIGLLDDKGRPTCSNCGSTKVHSRGDYTAAGYKRFQCKDCKTPLRGRRQQLSVEQRDNALTYDRG